MLNLNLFLIGKLKSFIYSKNILKSVNKKKASKLSEAFFSIVFLSFYELCINTCFSSKTSSDSTLSSSGTQQSTGQTAAHCGSS